MSIAKPKRASTMARVSVKTLRALITFCEANRCGIILRFKGEEQGYVAWELRMLLAMNQGRSLCVRKGWDASPI